MPLFYQQDINEATRLAIWKIEENESFFSDTVPVQRAITHPHKRLQHLAGRYLLRYLFPAFPYSEILIADTRKPYLRDEQYHFSISHCGDYAAAIVSTQERVGIDIEIPTPRILRVNHKFLHPDELAYFGRNASPDEGIGLFTLLWCVKEALYKWWGNGEVDFSEMLRISPFEDRNEGNIGARLVVPPAGIHVQSSYVKFSELCLAWVASNG
jgi:phosphopantetheinyl transferase